MLAENLVEEFEMKEDEPWYDHRDLQQDLQLAAELGKTLLDRNTELEDSLQQMYTTNQEQLQEIEYLTKQVELLRQMNEQHAKVYEQLDVTARELEETNQKLVADSKSSQQKIVSLTETIECLQTNIDHLQSQVEELKSSGQGRRRQRTHDQEKPAPSFSCLKEFYDLRQHFVYDHVFAEKIASWASRPSRDEEEHGRLKEAAAALQAQLSLERRRRAAVEEEYGLVLQENGELERRLEAAEALRARALELEAEVAELRRRLRPRGAEEPPAEPGPSLLDELLVAAPLERSRSDTGLGGARKPGGVSLLHEVDAQYTSLQAKYEELQRRCRRPEDSLAHKAVQTSRAAARDPPEAAAAAGAWEPAPGTPPTPPPEYKTLFKEIFSCIEKAKQEIDDQRAKSQPVSPPS